jgi:hypothetical protein
MLHQDCEPPHHDLSKQKEEQQMPTKTLTISDDVLWGKLVKSWATGRNYVNPGEAPPPVPRTREELLAQCADVGLEVEFPGQQVGLAVLQYSPQTVVLKLPPKEMVEETEAALAAPGAQYPMPIFYEAFFATPLPKLNEDQLMKLHAARIGDYAIRNCG